MIKTKNILLFITLFIVSSSLSLAQEMELNQVMRLHRRAVGGIDAITAFVTAELELTQTRDGKGSQEVKWFFGEEGNFRELNQRGRGENSLLYDGVYAYRLNPASGFTLSFHAPDGTPEDRYFYNLARSGCLLFPLMNAEKQGASLDLISQDGTGVVLQAVYPDDSVRTFILDARMKILEDVTQVSTGGIEITISKTYRNYKEYDGAILPSRASVEITGHFVDMGVEKRIKQNISYSLKSAKGNVDIKPEFFAPGIPEQLMVGYKKPIRAGNFIFGGKLPAGVKPMLFRKADLNNDGHVDLVVANTEKLNLLFGNGEGQFASRLTLFPDRGSIRDVLVRDLNEDGYPEILVGTHSGLNIYYGNSLGRFTEAVKVLEKLSIRRMAFGNLDDDKIIDLVISDPDATKLILFLGTKTGRFSYTRSIDKIDSTDFIVEDFNGDAKADIAVLEDDSLLIFYADKETYRRVIVARQLAFPTSLVSCDFNGDSHHDIFVGCGGEKRNSGEASVALIKGTAGEGFEEAKFLSRGSCVTSVKVADVSGDGVLDLLVSNFGSHRVNLLLNEENILSFAGFLPAGWSPVSVIAVDVNRDKHTDILILNKYGNDISLWLNQGQ